MELEVTTTIDLPDMIGIEGRVAYAKRWEGGIVYEYTASTGDIFKLIIDKDGFLDLRINNVGLFDCNMMDMDREMVISELMDAINSALSCQDLGEAIDWEDVFENFELSDDCYMW